jgi:hypothetical protein
MNAAKSKNAFVAVGALLGWMTIITQLVLMIQNRVTDIPEVIIRFFSFFTILTNIIVAICFTVIWRNRHTNQRSFWSSTAHQTAITVYILVVGIIYNLILRSLWSPTGLQKIVDELLHLLIPILFLIYWIVFVSKHGLQWRYALNWLLYPLIYLVFILIRGALSKSDFYPYPFVDVYNNGYQKVMISCGFILLLFVLLSLLFIAVGRLLSKKLV